VVRFLVIAYLFFILAGCESESADHRTIKWFKHTFGTGLDSPIGGLEVSECAGLKGDVSWKIFKGKGQSEGLRVVQAAVRNGAGNKAVFQWAVDPHSFVYEMSYAEIDGETQSRASLGLNFSHFCNQ
jgi:hypothetical protein